MLRKLLKNRDLSWHEVSYRAKGIFAVVLSVAVLATLGIVSYTKIKSTWGEFTSSEDYSGDGEKPVRIVIPEGVATYEISDILFENDVIKSAKTFDTVAGRNPDTQSIQAGSYNMKTKMSCEKALGLLLDPKNMVHTRVRIIEGLRLDEQLNRLAAKPNEQKPGEGGTGLPLDQLQAAAQGDKLELPDWLPKDRAALDTRAEGFLFPDTYEFPEKATSTQILQAMVKSFRSVTNEVGFENNCKKLNYELYQCLIVASIIEKEIKNPADGPKVARVIYNRLKKDNMKLGMDSTVYYAFKIPAGKQISEEQLKTDHPYSTYARAGLPPGPICAPGKNALSSAVQPAEGDWLYFTTVNMETGETKFETTIEEHNANAEVFRQWCRKNPDKCVR